VTAESVVLFKQVPLPSSVYFVQRKLIGLHWNMRKKKYMVLKTMTAARVE
tara:strand:+ start:500 stop:649 length:150 start_codon:yes stop_codon:yes gene_type:complete